MCLRSQRISRRTSSRCPARATGVRAMFPQERLWSSAVATPDSRSPKSYRRPTRSTLPSDLGRHRCRSECSGAMSSGGSRRRDSSTRRSTRASDSLAQRRETLVGLSPRAAKRHGVEIKPRVVGASGRTVTFADGSELEVDGVIWATGYRSDYDWIDVPVFGQDGRVRHRRGVTDYPGLFFLGLYWQYTRGSALLGWVKDDAEFISERIAANADNRTAACWSRS